MEEIMQYFSHKVESRRDEKIDALIEEFGAEGYAVWFALLEEISQEQKNLYMLFITRRWLDSFSISLRMRKSKVRKILDKLANFGMIDYDLYQEDIIFSQKFIKIQRCYIQKIFKSGNNSVESCMESVQKLFKIRKGKSNKTMTYDDFFLKLCRIRDEIIHPIKKRIEKKNKEIKENNINENKEEIKTNETEEKNQKEVKSNKQKFLLFRKSDWQYLLAEKLFEEVKKRDSTFPNVNLQTWANTFNMISKERNIEEIEKVMEYSQKHPFWSGIILSPNDLWNNFAKIKQAMINNTEKSTYSYEEMQLAMIKQKRNKNDFIACIDEKGEIIYWDKSKGNCPYRIYEQKENIEAVIDNVIENKSMVWNITKQGIKLPEDWHYREIIRGKKEYQYSGLKLIFDSPFAEDNPI